MIRKLATALSGALLIFGALTTTTNPMSIWQPTPSASPTVVAPAPIVPDTTLASYTRTIQKVTYTITVVRKNLPGGVDGYAVRVVSPTKTLLNVAVTKSGAAHVITFVQQYKPTTAQMLTARLLVLALL